MTQLTYYLSFPFVRHALLVGVLIALVASLLGVTLVLKRFSFIGDGLSHVAFGAVALASVLGLSGNMPLVLIITIIAACLLMRTSDNAKIHGDAGIAVLSVGALAAGYLLLGVFDTSTGVSGDVCSTLFGGTSILTLTTMDVWLTVVLAVVVLLVFFLFYHKIFAITFDEVFARASGMRTQVYNMCLAVVIAVIIVLAMNLVGSLLVSALIVFPALSAMRLFRSFRGVTIFAACFGVVGAGLGIIVSVLWETPTGATIAVVDLIGLGVCMVLGGVVKRVGRGA